MRDGHSSDRELIKAANFYADMLHWLARCLHEGQGDGHPVPDSSHLYSKKNMYHWRREDADDLLFFRFRGDSYRSILLGLVQSIKKQEFSDETKVILCARIAYAIVLSLIEKARTLYERTKTEREVISTAEVIDKQIWHDSTGEEFLRSPLYRSQKMPLTPEERTRRALHAAQAFLLGQRIASKDGKISTHEGEIEKTNFPLLEDGSPQGVKDRIFTAIEKMGDSVYRNDEAGKLSADEAASKIVCDAYKVTMYELKRSRPCPVRPKSTSK